MFLAILRPKCCEREGHIKDLIGFEIRDHSFSTFAKFSKKLTFLHPNMCMRMCISGGRSHFLWFLLTPADPKKVPICHT